MRSSTRFRTYALACSMAAIAQTFSLVSAQQQSNASKTIDQHSMAQQGLHDFDFAIGTWKVHLSRLVHPLTGSTDWVQLEGTSRVSKVWDGRANLVEIEVDGSSAHIEGLSLNLYNPQSRQWSLNFASSNDGTLNTPTVGEFKNGVGEFYDQESIHDKTIFVRKVYSNITPKSFRFEEAYSDNGGRSWEVNWIATFNRVTNESDNEH
jgi:hypothetical protein